MYIFITGNKIKKCSAPKELNEALRSETETKPRFLITSLRRDRDLNLPKFSRDLDVIETLDFGSEAETETKTRRSRPRPTCFPRFYIKVGQTVFFKVTATMTSSFHALILATLTNIRKVHGIIRNSFSLPQFQQSNKQ